MPGESRQTFEPKILGFLCQWCGYAGADLAGVSRYRYPSNLRIVRVMCSGRVDPVFIVDAFQKGMDGVMVIGCHPGDCHYISGNYEAANVAEAVKLLLGYSGVNTKRFMLDWVSASEGMRFSRLATEFTSTISKLGPLGKGDGELEEGLAGRLNAAKAVAQQEKLRYLLGRFSSFIKQGNKYGERFTRQEMRRMLERLVLDELLFNRILLLLEGGPLTAKDISAKLAQPVAAVLPALIALKRKGLLEARGMDKRSPLYITTKPAEAGIVC